MKLCEYCGNEFEGEVFQPYCSKLCTSKACGLSLQIKQCKNCGQEFESITDDSCCSFDCTYQLPGTLKVTIKGI